MSKPTYEWINEIEAKLKDNLEGDKEVANNICMVIFAIARLDKWKSETKDIPHFKLEYSTLKPQVDSLIKDLRKDLEGWEEKLMTYVMEVGY